MRIGVYWTIIECFFDCSDTDGIITKRMEVVFVPKYLSRCPKCGGHLSSICEWDIVVAHECSKCGFYKSYGYVVGPPENYYLVEDDPDLFDMDNFVTEEETSEQKTSHGAEDDLQQSNIDPNDDLPF